MSILDKIPADKKAHFVAGIKAAAAGALLGMLAAFAALHLAQLTGQPASLIVSLIMVGTTSLTVAGTAAATKEYADKMDNASVPGMHEVSIYDALATTLPGIAVAAACFVAAFLEAQP